MKVITKKELVSTFLDRYKEQLNNYRTLPESLKKIHEERIKKIGAIENPTELDISKILGNNTWTANYCDECEEDSEVSIILGETILDGDGNNRPANICSKCLLKAHSLITRK